MANKEFLTLREVLKLGFADIASKLADLERDYREHIPDDTFQDYLITELRYQVSSLSESLEEVEQRLVAIENYQHWIRFVSRQVSVVVVSVAIALLLFWWIVGG